MATIIKSFTFSSGATISASEHNTNFDTLYTLVNGNIDNANIKESAGIVYSKLTLTNSIVLADLASAIKSGSDATLITGTAGTENYVPKWNADGDLIDGYALIDDDTMATASATNIPSAESIKAYVDNVSDKQLFTSSGIFTAPAGITSVYVTLSGGGGGGGSWDPDDRSGGGGGAGAWASRIRITVTPGGTYTVTVGAGGTGGIGSRQNGTAGTASSFASGSYTLTANGGSGGTYQGNGGAGGTVSGSHSASGATAGSPQTTAGGNGGAMASLNEGGAGGANPFCVGGAAGNPNGGNATFGGGGGGGDRGGSGNGGNGGAGFVLVEW